MRSEASDSNQLCAAMPAVVRSKPSSRPAHYSLQIVQLQQSEGSLDRGSGPNRDFPLRRDVLIAHTAFAFVAPRGSAWCYMTTHPGGDEAMAMTKVRYCLRRKTRTRGLKYSQKSCTSCREPVHSHASSHAFVPSSFDGPMWARGSKPRRFARMSLAVRFKADQATDHPSRRRRRRRKGAPSWPSARRSGS